MGIIQKDSSISTIYLLVGVLLGFISAGLLFPNYFTIEQNGIISVLTSYYLIYSQIALFGLHTTVIRFYPHFKKDNSGNNQFLTIMSLVVLCSILVFSMLFITTKQLFPIFFDDTKPFMKYYWYVLPLTIVTVYFYLFDAYYTVRLKGTKGFFLKDVLQRILVISIILLFIIFHFNFNLFVILYVIAIAIPTIVFKFYLIKEKQFSYSLTIPKEYNDNWRYMAKVSGYSAILGISWVGVNNIDAIMIESMLDIKEAGIYGRNMFFGALVAIPYRAIHKISSGIISNSFKENNIENIKQVYYKSSINQMILGLYIFLGIWLNVHNVYHFIPESFISGKYVIFYIGLGNLFTLIGGVNTAIISFSPYYRMNTIFTFILLLLVIITNYIFIPQWGIVGAAIATALSIFLYNLMMYIFLWKKYQFQPIGLNHIKLLVIAMFVFGIVYFIPKVELFWLDILIRASIFSVLFGILVLGLKISDDINQMVFKTYHTFRNKIGFK